MAQPYNYMLNVPNPADSVMEGVRDAVGIAGVFSQQKLAQQQAQKQAQMQADLGAIASNPTPAALASMMVKYPEMSESFKRTYDVLDSQQKSSRLDQATQVYSALSANKPEIAQQYLVDQAVAYRNAGQEKEAKTLEDLSTLIKESPETAKTSTGLFLASAMGPDKFAETFTKLEGDRREAALAPAQLSKAQSDAQKAAVDARFAESNAVRDLAKKGWEIQKLQNDIGLSRENTRIAALNANLKRETNELKRAELGQKLEEAKLKRDEKVAEKAAGLESSRSSMDNMLNTADRILNTPDDVWGSATGPISTRLPTASQDTADFEELVNTLSSQAFMAQIPNLKGMGALSNAEGEKLQSSLQNLSLRQSPERLRENVKEAQRIVLKARANLANRYGVPDTIPDTPASAPAPATVDELLQKYGGGQ